MDDGDVCMTINGLRLTGCQGALHSRLTVPMLHAVTT